MDIAKKFREAGDIPGGEKALAEYRKKRDAVISTVALLNQAAADGRLPDVRVLFQQLLLDLNATGYTGGL